MRGVDMPYLSRDDIEKIAERVVCQYKKIYVPERHMCYMVDATELAEMLGFKIEYVHITRDGSILLLEQIITVDKQSLGDYIGTATEDFMDLVDHALAISVGIPPLKNKKSSEWKANRKQLLAEQKRQKAIEKRQASQPKTATQ